MRVQIGGQHARQYRLVDFKRTKTDVVGTVAAIGWPRRPTTSSAFG